MSKIYKFDNLIPANESPLVELKCILCGYEEQIPAGMYESAAEFSEYYGCDEPPSFFCINCMCESLYLKVLVKDWFDKDGNLTRFN